MKMMPGMGNDAPDTSEADAEMKKFEAVIYSMTPKERQGEVDLTMGRRKRVAKGSGISLGDVNKLIKKFNQMKEMIKHMPAMQKKFSEQEMKKIGTVKKNPHFDRFFS